MTELTSCFDKDSSTEIIESAKIVGMVVFLRIFIPRLLGEKFKISIFLEALGYYLEECNFSAQVVNLLEQSSAEARRVESQIKEAKDRQDNGLS